MKIAFVFRWFWRVAILIGIIYLIPYSWALIFALVTAIMLDGPVNFISKVLKVHRLFGVLISFIVYVGGVMTLIYFLLSVLIKRIMIHSEILPSVIRNVYITAILPIIRQWEQYSQTLPANLIGSIELTMEKGVMALEEFSKGLVSDMVQFATLVPAFFIDFLIYLIALFLISLELPLLKKKAISFLKDSTYQKITMIYQDLSLAAVGFVRAQLILSLFTFVMAYSGLRILHVSYPFLLALLIVLVDILPILGTGSVLVPWAIIVWQGNPHLGIGLIVLFLLITILRRVIEPKVYSANMGLTPLASLVSLYLGFKVLGVIGLFVGPALLIVYETLKKAGVIKLHSFKL